MISGFEKNREEHVLLLGYAAAFIAALVMVFVNARRIMELYRTPDQKFKIDIFQIVVCLCLSLISPVIFHSKNYIIDVIRGFFIFSACYMMAKFMMEFLFGDLFTDKKKGDKQIIPPIFYVIFALLPIFVLFSVFLFIFTR